MRTAWLKARYAVEYVLARLVLLLIDLLPLRAAVWLAARFGAAGYRLMWRRRQIARDNILFSGIATDRREAGRIARRSFQNFMIMIVEALKSDRLLNDGDWRRRVKVVIPPEVEALLAEPGRGVIVAGGHFGNWEIAAQLISTIKPVAGVTRPMSNPLAERLVQSRKPRFRFRMIPKNAADPARFLQVLRSGEILALMIDQHGGKPGTPVPFFGHPASTHTGIALLQLVTGAPLCFGYCLRTGLMQYEMRAVGPLRCARSGDRRRDVLAILEVLNSELEKAIRQAPEQYMWGHRRWRGAELEHVG